MGYLSGVNGISSSSIAESASRVSYNRKKNVFLKKRFKSEFTGFTSINSNTAKSSPARFSPNLNSYHWNGDCCFRLLNKSSLAVVENRPIKSGSSF